METWQAGPYRLYLHAGHLTGVKAVIRLEEQSGSHALNAYFTTQDPLPGNILTEPFYFLYFPYAMFSPMMKMLREEKPIWVHALDTYNVYIGTHQEPIEKDEGA